MGFVRDNWVALLSLAVATVGGVPGIISALEHRKKRAMLRISIGGLIVGDAVGSNGYERTMLLLAATIGNDGDTPITPGTMEAKLRMNDKWYALRPDLIPADLKFEGAQALFEGDLISRDLQQQRFTITPANPVTGMLMYSTAEFTSVEWRKGKRTKIRFKTIDLLGRVHETDAPLTLSDMKEGTAFPKHGMTFLPKEPKF